MLSSATSSHLLLLCQCVGHERVELSLQLCQLSRSEACRSLEHITERSPKRARHSTTEKHRPIKISEKRVFAQLIDALSRNAAQSLQRVFRAKLRDEVFGLGGNMRPKFLMKV